MGILDKLYNIGQGILSTGKRVGSGILTGLDKARDMVRNISRTARKIPSVDALLKTKIPVLGESLDDLGNVADSAIEIAKDVGGRFGVKSAKDELQSVD